MSFETDEFCLNPYKNVIGKGRFVYEEPRSSPLLLLPSYTTIPSLRQDIVSEFNRKSKNQGRQPLDEGDTRVVLQLVRNTEFCGLVGANGMKNIDDVLVYEEPQKRMIFRYDGIDILSVFCSGSWKKARDVLVKSIILNKDIKLIREVHDSVVPDTLNEGILKNGSDTLMEKVISTGPAHHKQFKCQIYRGRTLVMETIREKKADAIRCAHIVLLYYLSDEQIAKMPKA